MRSHAKHSVPLNTVSQSRYKEPKGWLLVADWRQRGVLRYSGCGTFCVQAIKVPVRYVNGKSA